MKRLILLIALLALLCPSTALAADPPASKALSTDKGSTATEPSVKPATLKVDNRPIFTFRGTLLGYTPSMRYPIIHCGCPVGDAPHKMRLRVKTLLRDFEAEHPGIKANLLSSLGRVRLRYLMPGHFSGSGDGEKAG